MKRAAFQQLQYRFAAHLRDPSRHAPPAGIEPRRLRIYADLFYNNVQSFLANAFPVLRTITPDAQWHALVRDFFARHRSPEPLFHKIAGEFLRYLETGRRGPRARDDWPFLRELAHYEWAELALAVADVDVTPELADPDGDLVEGAPVLSPLAWPLTYAYPVHRIGPDFLPREPDAVPTHLIVYRDRQDAVKFIEANAVTVRLLQLMDARRTGRALLTRIARELRHPEPAAVVAQGAGILDGLRARDVVLGTARKRRPRRD